MRRRAPVRVVARARARRRLVDPRRRAALGVLLGVLTRGTSIAIGLGILYALLIEGLLSNITAFEPIAGIFLRANAYSLTRALGVTADSIAENGPGSFGGPYVGAGQAVAVLGGLHHRVPGGRAYAPGPPRRD